MFIGLLAATIGGPGDNRPRRQLQVPVAQILLASVAGISTNLYSGPGAPGKPFVDCLVSFFPWDVDSPKGASKEAAAKILYDTFRNPLMHYLGMHMTGYPAVKITQIFRGTDDAEARVQELEQSAFKPFSEPSLVDATKSQTLWLDPLYWGIRKLVERWSRDSSEVASANERLLRLLRA